MNGAEIRKALSASPETPLPPVLSGLPVQGDTSLSVFLQQTDVPLHADYYEVEGSDDQGSSWFTLLSSLGPESAPNVFVQPGSLLRFTAVNPNGRTSGDHIQITI